MVRFDNGVGRYDIKTLFNQYTLEDINYLGSNLLKLLKASGLQPKQIPVPDKISALPTRKAERIEWITSCLQDAAVLKYLYEQMDPLAQSAVQELVHGPNSVLDSQRFAAKYGGLPQMTTSNNRYYYRRQDRDKIAFRPYSLVVSADGRMAPEIKALMHKFVPAPQKLAVPYMERLPEKQVLFNGRETAAVVPHNTAEAAASDLVSVLLLIDQGKIRVGAKTGKPTDAGAKTIRQVLHSADFYAADLEPDNNWDVAIGTAGIRPMAWCMLLQGANLAQAAGTKLQLSRTGKGALKKPPHVVLKTVWQRWLKTTQLHEMNRIEVIKGQKSKKRPLYQAQAAREAIAAGLAELAPGKWVATEDFLNFMVAAGHELNLVRNAWGLYIGDAQYGSLGYAHVRFSHIEGRFARAFLLEYAATLGIIDVALVPPWGALSDYHDLWGIDEFSCLSRYDGLLALRLNALGAWILGQTDNYTPAVYDTPCLQVLPNLEVTLVSAEASAPDRLFLDRVFEPVSDRVWRIELPKLLKAVEQGVELKTVIEFLTSRNQGPLPQPVTLFLDEALHRSGRLTDCGTAQLIECADAALAQLLANDTKLRALCFAAGQRHLAVPKDNLTLFHNRLRALGYVVAS